MCGIVGFVGTADFLNKEQLHRMSALVIHRGPDASGHFFRRSEQHTVGLGHRRLSIIDITAQANQPMISPDGRYVMVYNGEVYNFRELRTEIEQYAKTHAQSIEWRTSSDTEVVLWAYMLFGPSFVEKLNGMFAAAIYDTEECRCLLFRDRMGVKPLYYYCSNNVFAFASELKALTALQPIQLSIDQQALYAYLHLGYIPAPLTIYKEIRKFPQGCMASLSSDLHLDIKPYWTLSASLSNTTLTDEQEAKSRLKVLLEDSVRHRLISDVPFGTFLSGGIDSSIVTAVAQRVSSTPVQTFSIGFSDSKHNEAEYAKAVARHLGTQHTELYATEADAKELIPQLPAVYDEPYADSSAIPMMLVSKLAKQSVTMTLSGDGGDELFMGYGAYTWAERLRHPFMSAFRKPMAYLLSKGNSRYKRVGQLLNYRKADNLAAHIFSQEQCMFSACELECLLGSSAAVEVGDVATARSLTAAEQQALFDMHYYLPDDLLVKVDRAAMRYGMEVRVPLLDYRIVEFSLNLDVHLKRHNGESKYLLKQLLYDYVPKELFDRPKWGFSIPLSRWLQTDLAYLIEEVLTKQNLQQFESINYEEVCRLKAAFKAGETYLYNRLWLLIVLVLWQQQNKR